MAGFSCINIKKKKKKETNGSNKTCEKEIKESNGWIRYQRHIKMASIYLFLLGFNFNLFFFSLKCLCCVYIAEQSTCQLVYSCVYVCAVAFQFSFSMRFDISLLLSILHCVVIKMNITFLCI